MILVIKIILRNDLHLVRRKGLLLLRDLHYKVEDWGNISIT